MRQDWEPEDLHDGVGGLVGGAAPPTGGGPSTFGSEMTLGGPAAAAKLRRRLAPTPPQRLSLPPQPEVKPKLMA